MKVGDKIQEFAVVDQSGKIIKSSDFLGKKWVLFFYPKASTPGCTQEVCNLRDNYKILQSKGYSLLGVSADNPSRQAKFKQKYQLPFSLLADEEKQVIKAFGVWGEKKFMGKIFDGIHRKTFVMDEQGKVIRIIEKVKTKDHASQILQED